MPPMMGRRSIRWTLAVLALALIAGGLAYWLHFQPTPVPVVTAQKDRLSPTLEVPGTVEARLEYTVGARIASTVTAMKVDQRDRVSAGQELVELDDREQKTAVSQAEQALAAARAAEEAARAARDKARAQLGRARRDHERNRESDAYVSAAELDASETGLRVARETLAAAEAELRARRAEVNQAEEALAEARTRLSHTRVTAPGRGMVIEREAEPGETVQPGGPLLTLIDPETLWVTTRVDETVVGQVAVGQPASIRLRSGETLAGQVRRVEALSDTATRELAVNVAFDRRPERVILHEEARVTIRTDPIDGIRVPASAVTYRGNEARVLVINEGRARGRQVSVAATAGDRILVDGGLEAATPVIVGADEVSPGQRVTAARPGDN